MKLPTRFPTMKDVRNSKVMKEFKRITGSNPFITFVAKTIMIIIFWLIALIPTWLYIGIRLIAGPENFWQELAIIVICMLVTGWIQLLTAIIAAFITVAVFVDDTI